MGYVFSNRSGKILLILLIGFTVINISSAAFGPEDMCVANILDSCYSPGGEPLEKELNLSKSINNQLKIQICNDRLQSKLNRNLESVRNGTLYCSELNRSKISQYSTPEPGDNTDENNSNLSSTLTMIFIVSIFILAFIYYAGNGN
jgi:hypothetical protein